MPTRPGSRRGFFFAGAAGLWVGLCAAKISHRAAYQGFSGDPLPEPGEPVGNPFDPLPTPETDRPAPPDTLAPVSRVSSWDFDGLRGLFGVVTAAPD